jgi:alpha-glucosidase
MPIKKWSGHETIYQVYPLSFMDANGDGRGDLKGIISRLDYIRNLGVDAIWLSPFYCSSMFDFGYDVVDHRRVDPLFGTLKDADCLIAGAHRRSLRVMFDFVGNHTSSLHPWFRLSKSSRSNAKRDWYVWKDPAPDGRPPNNWLSVFGGSAWTYDETTSQYYLHSFLKEQPDLNWRNPEAVREMIAVMEFWLKRGVDGFRMDAVYFMMKDPLFRDDPRNAGFRASSDDPFERLRHIHSQHHPDTFSLLRRLGRVTARYGALMIGEAHLTVREMQPFYRRTDPRRYMPMNLNLIDLPWTAEAYRKFLASYERSLTPGDFPNYILGNHDRSRVATRLGDARARAAAVLQLTLRGMPFIYYGEEIGMKDIHVDSGHAHDPFGVLVPGLQLGRDPQRSPMRWTAGPYAGFGKAEPWLPIGGNTKKLNVEHEQSDPHSFLTLYRTLLRLRKMKALRSGKLRLMTSGNGILAFRREAAGSSVVVVVNFTGKPQRVSVGAVKEATVLCDSALKRKVGSAINLHHLQLAPNEAVVGLVMAAR